MHIHIRHYFKLFFLRIWYRPNPTTHQSSLIIIDFISIFLIVVDNQSQYTETLLSYFIAILKKEIDKGPFKNPFSIFTNRVKKELFKLKRIQCHSIKNWVRKCNSR